MCPQKRASGSGAVGKDEVGAETGPSLKVTCATIKRGALLLKIGEDLAGASPLLCFHN